jgi:gliding motility-associated-like protein
LFFWTVCIPFLMGQNQINTLAGTGSMGQQDGPALSASFNRILFAIPDSKGNIFISDYDNHCIRKLDTNGMVTTFVGLKGTSGFADGTGTQARFYRPFYMVIDSNDVIYLCDAKNHAIRKITPTGVVSTLAGNGTVGFIDGVGNSARLNHPYGICFDQNQNLVFTDRFNHAVRRLDLNNNQVTTLSSTSGSGFQNGILSSSRFDAPHGIVHDGNGNFYVADRDNNRARKISSANMVTTLAGNGNAGFQDGPLLSSTFSIMSGIAIDAYGNIYIGDYGNHAIRMITTTQVTTIAGNGLSGFQNGNPLTNCLTNPHGIWVSQDSCPRILIGDHFNHSLRELYTKQSLLDDTLSTCSSGIYVTLPTGVSNVLWSTGSNADSIFINQTGSYWVAGAIANCSFADTFQVEIQNLSLTSISNTYSICPGSSYTVQIPQVSSQQIVWFDGSADSTRTFSSPGSYWVTRITPCDTLTDTIDIIETGPVFTSVSQSHTICDFEDVTIQLPVVPNQSINWFDGSNALTRTFSSTGNYWVTRTAPCDTLTDTISITVINCDTIPPPPADTISRIFIPNVFTPNNDGINDFFLIQGTGINDYHIAIFNRWGTLLYESKNMSEAWDGTSNGTDIVEGVYTYLIIYRTWNDKYREEYGHVTVFR